MSQKKTSKEDTVKSTTVNEIGSFCYGNVFAVVLFLN